MEIKRKIGEIGNILFYLSTKKSYQLKCNVELYFSEKLWAFSSDRGSLSQTSKKEIITLHKTVLF